MILFIGSQAAGYFVSDVAAAYRETVTYTGAFSSLEEAGDAALESLYDFIIINVEELPGSHEEIADLLFRVQKATKSTFVVMAENYSPQSELIQNIQKAGISHLLTASSLGGIKEQLEQILSWTPAPSPPSTPDPEIPISPHFLPTEAFKPLRWPEPIPGWEPPPKPCRWSNTCCSEAEKPVICK